MLRPIFQPETRPNPAEVLFEIDEKYGFSTSMDFVVAPAYYTGTVIHRTATSTGCLAEDTTLLLEGRAKAAWVELDTYDKRPYMNR